MGSNGTERQMVLEVTSTPAKQPSCHRAVVDTDRASVAGKRRSFAG
jgi:hypothetical protein